MERACAIDDSYKITDPVADTLAVPRCRSNAVLPRRADTQTRVDPDCWAKKSTRHTHMSYKLVVQSLFPHSTMMVLHDSLA
jgi:hypothetical protein